MNKRLEMLEKMTNSGQADSFAWYGLAMEYRLVFERLANLTGNGVPKTRTHGRIAVRLRQAS